MFSTRRRFLYAAGLSGMGAVLSGCGQGAGPGPAPTGGPGLTPTPGSEPTPIPPPSPAAKGRALTIGLNRVDPAAYGGWAGDLVACEFDANDMARIARANQLQTESLLTAAATRQAVIDGIRRAADELSGGDLFMLSYSGHGGQVRDFTSDEEDTLDETWCLFDGEMLDDELFDLWARFRPGVRILLFSDSCHSGTVNKVAVYRRIERAGPLRRGAPAFEGDDAADRPPAPPPATAPAARGEPRYRAMPPDVMRRLNQDPNRNALYQRIQQRVSRGDRAPVAATVLLISGCQDNQLSLDGWDNGLFTSQLKATYGGVNGPSTFGGHYRAFHQAILRQMPPTQSPNYSVVGSPNAAFEAQRIFTL